METIFVGSQIIVGEEHDRLYLEYYLTESKSDTGIKTYGMKIVQDMSNIVQDEVTGPISEHKEFVEKLLHTLKQNSVTATTMIEVVDDLVTLGF